MFSNSNSTGDNSAGMSIAQGLINNQTKALQARQKEEAALREQFSRSPYQASSFIGQGQGQQWLDPRKMGGQVQPTVGAQPGMPSVPQVNLPPVDRVSFLDQDWQRPDMMFNTDFTARGDMPAPSGPLSIADAIGGQMTPNMQRHMTMDDLGSSESGFGVRRSFADRREMY